MFKSDRIRRLFGYSRRERQGTYLLSLILVVVLLARILGLMHPDSPPVEEARQSVEEKTVAMLFPFDPNSAGIDDLVLLGLSQRQATTLDNYRQAGGRFRKPEDFRKVYGLDSMLQEKLIPYICISEPNGEEKEGGARIVESGSIRKRAIAAGNSEGGSNRDYESRDFRQPGTAGNSPIRIELNSADSLLLKSLPGIGNVLSSRIVRYRNLLGGFVSVNQLKEVYGIDSLLAVGLKPMLFTDTTLVRALDINRAGYGTLLRHPYISEIEASLIIHYRNRVGVVESISELLVNRIIEPARFRRVFPYLTVTTDSILL